MVRLTIRGCAAGVVALGLTAASTASMAETAAVPAIPAAVAATAPPPAAVPAPPAVTAEVAAELSKSLDAGLRRWFPPSGPAAAYRWDGQPAITPAGDHYEVSLPALQITSDDGSRVVVGVIRAALVPNPDGSWGVGLSVPPQFTLLAANGKPEGSFTIGSQYFFGRWLPAIGTFVEAEGRFGGIKAVSVKDSSNLSIDSVTLKIALTEQPPGRWSGPSRLEIGRLALTDEHGMQIVRLGNAALEATISDVDLARAVALQNQKAPAAAGAAPAGASEASRRAATALATVHGLFSAASAQLQVGDLTVTAPNDGNSFAVGKLSLHGKLDGLNQGRSVFALGYQHADLKLMPNPGPGEFSPDKVEFALSAVDLPNADLWGAFAQLVDASSHAGEDAGEKFAQQAQAALVRAGSQLRIDALRIETPAASANVKGNLHFNDKSAFGAVAAIDAVVRGIDATLKQLQPPPNTKPDEETQNTVTMLSMIQAFGVPGKDEAGRETRSYKVQVGADGKILLNGADMSSLFQAGQNQDSEAAPAKKAPKKAQ